MPSSPPRMNATWPTWFGDEDKDLTTPSILCIMESSMNETTPTVPYPVTVVDNNGTPVGVVTPNGEYNTNPPSKVGQVVRDEDEGVEFEVVWDGASKKSLLGVRT